MIKYSKYLLLILLFVTFVNAKNNPIYFVVNVKGKTFKQIETQKWQEIKNNQLLSENDYISIGANSFINLYDDLNKKYFVINGIRKFALKDLADNKIVSDSRQVNNILVRAFEDLANAFSGFADSRGLKTIFRSADMQELIAVMPRNTKISCDTLKFEWITRDNFLPIKLLILDENLNPVFDTLVMNRNSCSIIKKLEQGKEYVWQISAADRKKNIINYFSIPDDNEIRLFNNKLDSLNQLMGALDMPNYFMLKGLISEESGFEAAAYSFFKQAYYMADDKDKYGKIIEEFFNRQKINLKYTDILSQR
jgi:hypothetical protein